MKKLHVSRISVLIVIMFLTLLYIAGVKPDFSNVTCARTFKAFFTWNVYLPLFGILLFFNLIELINLKNNSSSKLDWLLLMVLPSFLVFTILKSIFVIYF